jgi:predicted transcriptional regulator of viral defense system
MAAPAQIIWALARQKGLIRLRDAQARGVHPEYVRRLASSGELARVGRGVYALPNAEVTEHHSLAEVAVRVPHSVVCLLTALHVHALGTQKAKAVWIAIDRKAARPRLESPLIRVVRFSKAALKQGVEERRIDGVLVRVTTPSRTVVDCFKYRNKIGLSIALEALRALHRRNDFKERELWKYTAMQRVDRVMKPYVEAIV